MATRVPRDETSRKLIAKFKAFSDSKFNGPNNLVMTSKDTGKLSSAAFGKYKEFDWFTLAHDAAFFACIDNKTKRTMTVTEANCNTYITKFAHEIGKKRTKNALLREDDKAVLQIRADLLQRVLQLQTDQKTAPRGESSEKTAQQQKSRDADSKAAKTDSQSGKSKGSAGIQTTKKGTVYPGTNAPTTTTRRLSDGATVDKKTGKKS